jgi:ureidoacrylate peracid hydrolase
MKFIDDRGYYETLQEMVAPEHAALLVIDQQNDFTHPDGYYAKFGLDLSMVQAITDPINQLTAAARSAGVMVIWSQNVIKQGFVSDSPVWLGAHAKMGLEHLYQKDFYTMEGTWGAEIFDQCEVAEGDVVLPKLRSTVFHNTPLEALLRAHGIETLIIAGQVTEGCVDNTIRGARDRDFYTPLVADAVASTSLERHDRVMAIWTGRIPTPQTEELVAIWSG